MTNSPPTDLPPASVPELEALDQAGVEQRYRPFLTKAAGETDADDWATALELDAVKDMVAALGPDASKIKILVLYGSLRDRCVQQSVPVSQRALRAVACRCGRLHAVV